MASYYNPSRRISEWAASALSPFIQLETEDGQTDQSRLSVGLWSGNVQLKNVELRPEAFDKYLNPNETDYNEYGTKIRWKIVRGSIDNVSVGIPWKRLLMGTSYSSSRKGKLVQVAEGQSELKMSVQRQGSGLGETGSLAEEEKEQTTNQPPKEDDAALSGCTTIKIDGLCLILGYDVIHQDTSLDPSQSQSFHDESLSEEQSKRLRDEKNQILQTAERRLLAGLDPFPPSLTESLQKDIQSVLQSSLEQSMSDHAKTNSSESDPSTTSTTTYRSKVENYFSSTIKSLLWRTYDSLSISVTHVKISVVAASHHDKRVRVFGRKRKRPKKANDTKPVKPHHRQRSSLHNFNRASMGSRFEFNQRFISTDVWDMNWEPYPGTIHTPVKRGRSSLRKSEGSLEIQRDENDSDYDSKDEGEMATDEDEDDAAIWSQEGYVELGFVLDKLEVRPGLVPQLPPKQEVDVNEEADEVKPTSVKHLHFRRIGAFARRGPFTSLTAKRARDPKTKRVKKDKKLPWHELDHDDFMMNPTNIRTEVKFYRHATADGDLTTVTSTRTTKDREGTSTKTGAQRMDNESRSCIMSSDISHATAGTKRRGKREKGPPKSAEPPAEPKSTIHTIESSFTESVLIPKQLELNWNVGHIRSTISSRHIFLMSSCLQSFSRSKCGRPSTTIRSAKAHDRKLIERMTEEGQPVVTALDVHMYRVLPQLRSTKYSRRTLLTLPRVTLSWWKWAIMSVLLELKHREQLIDQCSSTERRLTRNSLTTTQKLQWDWNEQTRIRKEYIELYLLVNSTSDENTKRSSVLAAESRIEEIEHNLPVERILLLRKVSRAASLSKNASESSVAPEATFYNFSSNEKLSDETISRAASTDNVGQIDDSRAAPETIHEQNNTTPAHASPSKLSTQDKAHDNLLLVSSSITVTGFSIALCELHHVHEDNDATESYTKEDTSDDISALTGFSDVSADSSSLHQLSEQHTVYEKFDPTYRFWEQEKHKLRFEPIFLLHISDISLSIQRSRTKQKCRVLVGGLVIDKEPASSHVFSIGSMGTDKPTPVNIPCMSILTVYGRDSSVSTVCSMKSSVINLDLIWMQRISAFLASNKESGRRSNLRQLYKEQSLRRVVSNIPSTPKMPVSLECESLQVNIPVHNGTTETAVVVMALNTLKFCTGSEINKDSTPERDDEYEMIIDEASVQIQPELRCSSLAALSYELFRIPMKVRVHGYFTGCQPVVELSPVHLMVSEIRARTILQLIRQLSTHLNDKIPDNTECVKPSLPAIAEYALEECQLSIEIITVHIFSDENDHDSKESSEEHLRQITINYLSLVSCLDAQYPNQDAMECISKLYEGQCMNLGLSRKDTRHCMENALFNFQSELKSTIASQTKLLPDKVDLIVSQASDMAISALTASPTLPDRGLIIQAEAVSVSLSSYYCKSMAQIQAKCLKVHDGSRINFLQIAEAEDGVAFVASLSYHTARQEIYFEIENADTTFDPLAYLAALSTCRSISDAVLMHGKSSNTSATPKAKPHTDLVVNGTLSSASMVFMDDSIPFVRLRVAGIFFDRSPEGEAMSANDVILQCVSPSLADSYPNVITTHKDCDGNEEHCASTLRIKRETGISSDANDVLISLDGVRVTVLRQFVNEMIQYISSPQYGLGLVLETIQPSKDSNETSPAPSTQVTVKCTNSTIILPRDSASIDLVGIEVDELSISPVYVKDSWTIKSYSFEGGYISQSKCDACNIESTRSSASEVFFDCVDDQIEQTVPTASQLLRIAINLHGARLFTALNGKQHSPDSVKLPTWNRFVSCTGRCEDSKPVYRAQMNSTNPLTVETRARVWQEVTHEPLNLVIKADLVPTPRLLIEMMGNSFLDMRMSQLYLLISIWYANMQQLPVLFPFDSKIIEETSKYSDPPLDWPEYGSDEFIKRLTDEYTEKEFELALCIKNFRLDCSFDQPGYFDKDPPTISLLKSDAVSVSLEHVICDIVSDKSNVMSIGIGATGMRILDGSATTSFEQHASVKNVTGVSSFVNLGWGLNCGLHTLVEGLSLPFQVTVYMTPDNHCMINLGADFLEGTLENLSSIWILLDYFGLYFKDAPYGNPCFLAEEIVQKVYGDVAATTEDVGLDIDFRLWLTRPHIIIPANSGCHSGVCIMLEADGIHYRYKSHGLTYSSQDIVAKDLGIVALREYTDPATSRGRRQVSGCLKNSGAQTLIDDLSFSIQYDFNESTNYTKLNVRVPLSREHLDKENMNGIEAGNIQVDPYQCKAPLVCKPFFLPSRTTNTKFSAYFSMEYMKLALDALSSFVGPKLIEDVPDSEPTTRQNVYSVAADVEGAELVLSDPVMGFHRPIISISLPSVSFTASQLQADELQMAMETTMFVDYFKLGKTRNWEPLIEPFQCLILYDKSSVRGQGVTINLDCPLHVNITSAAIDTFDDARDTFESFHKLIKEGVTVPKQMGPDTSTIECHTSSGITLLHSQAELVDEVERRAFTLKNNTGQQIRVHTISTIKEDALGSKATIYYLDHTKTMPLSFPATVTSIRNLEHVEVAVEDYSPLNSSEKRTSHHHHVVDVHVPGFQWLHGVSIEETGRKFLNLIPRSPQIQSKVDADWRLNNGVQLLADVRSINGGRRLSLHSPFELINKTDHSISVSFSPDPLHCPQSEKSFASEDVYPDDTCTVPHLLLERALGITGSHLGSIWIKPKPDTDLSQPELFGEAKTIGKNSVVEYPSRPIQLAKIVHETSVIWSNSKADPKVANQFASGTEISCPIKNEKSNPFCYVLEVKRSPLTSQQIDDTDLLVPTEVFSPGRGLKSAKSKSTKTADTTLRHQPVLYSLHIHPPIVIENLLPERGRFELMHATNKTVLWWGVLNPGQKVPVHTVGLDAPIVMLVNLRFCRTPVGEGALVHNGRDSEGLFKAGWNSLVGHAMKSSKEKVKRTLYAVTESKDNRGAGRISDMRRGINKLNDSNATRKVGQMGFNNEHESNENPNGMWYGDSFDADAIDTEMVVIDSIGQRLILHIDNVIGGGGQRFISLFCPYWVVNTTNHSLRYKQEKVSSFVSGTVVSPELDGSKSVDSSYRNDEDKARHGTLDKSNEGPYSTIFSGRPGALHIPSGPALEPAVLAALISEDLPLGILSSLAFMFNFQDTLSLGSPPRLCVQLADTTSSQQYTSAWSSGFGLESVGVTQIVGMHCKDGRRLEVSISVSIAPGRLSNYTKIVRICPRYVVYNQTGQTLRVWQDNSILHPPKPVEHSLNSDKSEKWTLSNSNRRLAGPIEHQYKSLFGEKITIDSDCNALTETTAHPDACYICTIHPSELIAFHLPDTRVDRLLRLEYGSSWNLSSSIPADVTGEYHITMTRALDLRMLPQVSTRAAPVYTITIPDPDKEWNGELGTYFETDWGRERTLIVKGVKESSYAAYWTDISVGDELISIDDTAVEQLTFEEAMKLLKSRLSSVKDKSLKRKARSNENFVPEPNASVVLTFMTFEERMRSLRRKAVIGRVAHASMESRRNVFSSIIQEDRGQSKDLLIDMKFLYQSIFIFVHEPKSLDPPHIIRNRSLQWAIFYRQRNCEGHPWRCLYPGESAAYTWQEPTKPKKLSVRVGTCEWISGSTASTETKARTPFLFNFVKDEEQGFYGATKTVKLEEIGHKESLPVPVNRNENQEKSIYCIVDTEGTTRALIISDEIKESYSDDEILIKRHLTNIRREIASEEKRRTQLDGLGNILTTQANISTNNCDFDPSSALNLTLIESELQDLIDFGEGQYISKRHQVLVQVLEATGLVSADLNGLSNPYVKISLKHQTNAFKSAKSRCTYYMEKTLSPNWSQQIFVFDTPPKAARDPRESRNVSLQCTVKSLEKMGKDRFLGQVQIQLRDLINQKEIVGWYPLMGALGQRDVDSVDRIRGSLKMRIHYVSNYQGLIAYHQLYSERRIDSLKKTKAGMQRQLRALRLTSRQQAEARDTVTGIPALTMIGKKSKKVSKLELARDEGLMQSKIIQGVRDGTENTFKKSIGIARSVVRITRKDPKSSLVAVLDDDLRSRCETDDDIYYGEHAEAVSNAQNFDDTPEFTPPSNKDCIPIVASALVSSPKMEMKLDQNAISNSISSLRDRCGGHPLALMPPNNPSLFLSYNTSRAFYRHHAPPHAVNTVDSSMLNIKQDYANLFKLPPSVPSVIQERENTYNAALMASRHAFSKKSRRSLNNILNPGGVLTIRPITALNLSDDYTGMFIKLRYGTTIQVSETVDCRVSPVWTRDESNLCEADITTKRKRRHSLLRKKKRGTDAGPTEFADLAEIVNPLARWGRSRKNDLQVEVSPFETSKSIRLSIIGERIQANVELGILDIELGPALECCTQSLEEFEEDRASEEPRGLPPAYVRWFPLTSPSDAIPVEGDLGQSTKPKESEKPRDDMFREYFAPCIKLALMFTPHSDDADEKIQQTGAIKRSSTDQYLYAKIDRISAALIDSNRIGVGELVSFTSRDADLRISLSKSKSRLSFAVGNVQIDQQRLSQDSKAPVILAPTPVKHPQPVLQFLVWKDNTRSKPDLDSFDYVALEVQDLDLKIDETWLFDLWEFYVAIAKTRERKEHIKQTPQQTLSQFSTGSEEETKEALALAHSFLQSPSAITSSKKVYIRELILGYLRISLWYYKRGSWSLAVDEELMNGGRYELFLSPRILSQRMSEKSTSDEAFKQWSDNIAYGDSGDTLSPSTINLVSAIIPSISDASVSFQGKLIEHVFETQGDVWKSLRSHYSSEALKQIYKIVGSLDFVGNPSMLLTSFRTGLKDFILQPSRELRHLTKNPSRVGVGVLKGTVSLFSNSTSGIFGFFSTLGFSAGQTATMFTFDEDFQRHHSEKQTAQQRHYDRWKRKGCGHVTLMFTRPIHDVVFGVISASTGLLTEPYRGAKRNGVVGFGKGVGVGVLGLVVKPVVGFCDAFAHFMGSIDDIAKSVNLLDGKFKPIERYRHPYTFGAGRMLMPFNQVQSKSAQLLFEYPIDKKSRVGDEVIVSSQALHIGPGYDHYIIVTTKRIVFFKLRDIDGTGFITISLDWQIRFAKGFGVSSSIGTKGYNKTVLHISSVSERTMDDISSSGSLDTDNIFRDSKHDGSSFNLEGSYAAPETPKAFRLRNARLFASTETDAAQRFIIEGDSGQRRQLIQVHNAICCLSGDMANLIYEGDYGKGNEGITSFGSLTFDLSDTRTEFEAKDPNVLFSTLEHAPWKHSQNDASTLCKDTLSHFFEGILDEEASLGTSHNVSDDAIDTLFPFSDYASYDSNEDDAAIEPVQRSHAAMEDQVDDFTFHLSSAPVDTTPDYQHAHDAPSLQHDETHHDLPVPANDKDLANVNGGVDSRLRRVEELLEHLVYKQSQEPVESVFQEQASHNLSPIRETDDKTNVSSNETTEVEALRNELAQLKLQMAKQAELNVQLQAQVAATKRSQSKGIKKLFGRQTKSKKKEGG